MEDKLVELMDQLQTLLAQYAPRAGELALGVVRVQALANLLIGLLLLAGFALLLRFTLREVHRKADWLMERIFGEEEVGPQIMFLAAPLALLAVPAGIMLLNPWNWIGAANPLLALAHRVLEKL